VPQRFRPLRLAAAALACVTAALAHAQASAPAGASAASAPTVRTTADIIKEAPDSAWRRPDPNDVLAMTLPSGIVWIELAPRFAPKHAHNIRTLVAQHYFDGLSVLRVQDNFVAQWGDRDADDEDATKGRPLGAAQRTLEPEFAISDQGLRITKLKDRDVWASVTDFVDSFPVTADPKTKVYGDANPALTATITGFVGGQNLGTSGITGSPSLSTAATAASPVGPYPIVVGAGTLAAANYQFHLVDGTLSVTKATLTVTADNKAKVLNAVCRLLSRSVRPGFRQSSQGAVLSCPQ